MTSTSSSEWNQMAVGDPADPCPRSTLDFMRDPSPPAGQATFSAAENSIAARIAVTASWIVNWFLLGAKLYAVIMSQSKALLAALADSVVDLVSQAVLSMADRYIARHSPDYPVGRSRLEVSLDRP